MDIQPFDLQRMFFGDLPLAFTLEVAFRTLFIYLYALTALRLLGRNRGLSALSLFEYAIIIALGSATGDAMFYPEVPLLHCMIVITLVVVTNQVLIWLSNRSERFEVILEGTPHRLIIDGMIDVEGLKKAALSQEEVFIQLRHEGIVQLGEVRRAYFETDGRSSVFRYKDEAVKAGLPIEPPWDIERPTIYKAGQTIEGDHVLACMNCGQISHYKSGEPLMVCSHCAHDKWTLARLA